MFKLRFLLDRARPLKIGGRTISSLTDLAELLETDDGAAHHAVAEALFDRRLECWVDAVRPVEESDALVTKLTALRERLTPDVPELAAFALLHTLDPARPVELSPGVTAASPSEIASALAQAPETARASIEALVISRRLEEWLRAAEFDNWMIWLI